MNLLPERIDKFLDACFQAGIKDPVGFLLAKRPQVYDWLRGAFPRGILPTDIDGEVEINGHFLRLEFKHETVLRNGFVPKGQRLALKALLLTGRFCVLLVGCDSNGDPSCVEIWGHNGKVTPLKDANKESIRKLCEQWSNYAASKPQ